MDERPYEDDEEMNLRDREMLRALAGGAARELQDFPFACSPAVDFLALDRRPMLAIHGPLTGAVTPSPRYAAFDRTERSPKSPTRHPRLRLRARPSWRSQA